MTNPSLVKMLTFFHFVCISALVACGNEWDITFTSLSLREPTLKRFRAALFAHAKRREFVAKIQSGFAVTLDKMDDRRRSGRNIWLAGGCLSDTTTSRDGKKLCVQGWAKEWSLGCVNLASWLPLVLGHEFTQPRYRSFAQPGMYFSEFLGRS